MVTEWLTRRTVPQYALILWTGGELCILLVIAVLTWLGNRPFNVALFVTLAVVIPLAGLPAPRRTFVPSAAGWRSSPTSAASASR